MVHGGNRIYKASSDLLQLGTTKYCTVQYYSIENTGDDRTRLTFLVPPPRTSQHKVNKPVALSVFTAKKLSRTVL